MAVFVAFLLFLGYGFDRFAVGNGEFAFPIGTLTALGVGSVSALSSYYSGDRAVLFSTGALPIDRAPSSAATEDDVLKIRQLQNTVEEMSIAAGLPVPAVYLIPDPDPNAFATGRDPAHASIAVTRGLLDAVTREELQGVVAHELSHVRNLDIRLMTVIAAMVGTIALLSDWTGRGLRHTSRGGGSSERHSGGEIGIGGVPTVGGKAAL
jgi:heat shock protein HtpX